jgi:hypothetical protein
MKKRNTQKENTKNKVRKWHRLNKRKINKICFFLRKIITTQK